MCQKEQNIRVQIDNKCEVRENICTEVQFMWCMICLLYTSLDKNAQYKNCLEENNVDILKPEAIYKLPQCYDYIIIAIENREIRCV